MIHIESTLRPSLCTGEALTKPIKDLTEANLAQLVETMMTETNVNVSTECEEVKLTAVATGKLQLV